MAALKPSAAVSTHTPEPSNDVPINDSPSSQFTKQATVLEQNMDDTLAGIANAPSSAVLSPDIQDFIRNMVTTQVKSIQVDTSICIDNVQKLCASLVTEVQSQRELINNNYESLTARINLWEEKVTTLMEDYVQLHDTLTDLRQNIPPIPPHDSSTDFNTLHNNMSEMQSTIQNVQVKFKDKLSKLKHATTTVLKQQEDKYGLLYDRVYQSEPSS